MSFTWKKIGFAVFGNLNDTSRRIWTENFTGHGLTETIFYNNGGQHWWLGQVDLIGPASTWSNVSTSNFGDLLDSNYMIWASPFSDKGLDEILIYDNKDQQWWLGKVDIVDASRPILKWNNATVSNFGNLPDISCAIWVGDFVPTGEALMIYCKYNVGNS